MVKRAPPDQHILASKDQLLSFLRHHLQEKDNEDSKMSGQEDQKPDPSTGENTRQVHHAAEDLENYRDILDKF